LTLTDEGVILRVRVQPRASRNRILGGYGGALKLALSAPPVEGAANQACIELLAKVFGLKNAQVQIKNGQKSRNKQVLLQGIEPEQVEERLKEILTHG